MGDSFISTAVAHKSIASCKTERNFGFYICVLVAGLSDGSTLGACGTGVPGGATLGVFTWGATNGGVAGKIRLGAGGVRAGRKNKVGLDSLRGVGSLYPNMSAGGSTCTLRTLLGAGIGGFTGGDRGGRGVAKITPSLVILVVKRGERRCCGCVGNLTGGGSCGISIQGVAAESEKIVLRRVSSLKEDSWRRWGMWPLIAVTRSPAAAIMASSGVVVGFEIYLCLWKTVADTQVAWVFII